MATGTRSRMWVWLLLAIVITPVAVLAILAIGELELELVQDTTLDVKGQVRRTQAFILGGVGAMFGLIVAGYRSWALMRQAQAEEQGQITERFTRAIDQLGKLNDKDGTPNVVVRLGGIYGLEQIAIDDPEKFHDQVYETLTAYVRESAPFLKEQKAEEETEIKIPQQKPREDIQAAVTVIVRRKEENEDEDQRWNLSGTDLSGAEFRGGNLDRASFWMAKLERAKFRGANLNGARFDSSKLGRADFRDAKLRKAFFNRAILGNARFNSAELEGAHFHATILIRASFDNATLINTHFEEARLEKVSFKKATLKGTNFNGAELEGVDFSDSMLEGVSFKKGADLTNAEGLTQAHILSAKFDEDTIFPDGKNGRTMEEVAKWTSVEFMAAGLSVTKIENLFKGEEEEEEKNP